MAATTHRLLSIFFFFKYFPNKYNINSITVINDDIQKWPNAISVLSKIKFKPKWISWWTRLIFFSSPRWFWSNFNYSGASIGRSNVYKCLTQSKCVEPKINLCEIGACSATSIFSSRAVKWISSLMQLKFCKIQSIRLKKTFEKLLQRPIEKS